MMSPPEMEWAPAKREPSAKRIHQGYGDGGRRVGKKEDIGQIDGEPLSGLQCQPMGRVLIHGFATEHEREVFIVGPEWQEIAVELALRLARLSWNLRDNRTVPV